MVFFQKGVWRFFSSSASGLKQKKFAPVYDHDKSKHERQVESLVVKFLQNDNTMRKAAVLGIPENVYRNSISSFIESFKNKKSLYLTHYDLISKLKAQNSIKDSIFSALIKHTHSNFPSEHLTLLADLFKSSDLRTPLELYPEARGLSRKIIFHVGPTNSGKTYNALKKLEQANSGVYLGPLRLLAHEIYERMNKSGIACNLVTGEERRESDGVNMISATVEMVPLNAEFDVAVIDEIQLIADEQRGWAWTQALLGLRAKEIHLCGEATVIPLVRRILANSKDMFEEHHYERLKPLEIDDRPVDRLKNVRKGDAIVAFSRDEIFAIKQSIEASTSFKCAVIYGALPPEIRAEQAKLFNNPDSGYDVLVASDAIGMGLNLNIRRVVFYVMEKFDGQNQVALTASHTKQIAGRAGRFASEYESGLVTTVDSSDLPFLRQQLKAPLKDLESAGILPTIEQIEQFAVSLPGRPLHVLLILFEYATRLEGNYNLCNLVEQKRIAEKLKDITALSLRDRYTLTMAPFPYVPKKSSFNETLIDLVELAGSAIAERRELLISEIVSLPEKLPDTPVKLKDLEFAHKKIILYLWLSFRFPHTFTETTLATQLKHQAESMINTSLERLQFTLRKKQKMASFADLVAPNPLAPPKNMEEILSSPVKDDLSSSQAPESVEETVTILQKGIGLGLDDPLRHAQDSERY